MPGKGLLGSVGRFGGADVEGGLKIARGSEIRFYQPATTGPHCGKKKL